MRPKLLFLGSLLIWFGVWCFWLGLTYTAHPTWALAIVVTTALIVAYALVTYLHHYYLIPNYLRTGRRVPYVMGLVGSMLLLTWVALVLIRFCYGSWVGPDADPYGFYKHYVIDLFGMVVHVGAASGMVWMLGVAGRQWSLRRMKMTKSSSNE